jgi:hypothetical protein
LPSFLWDIWTLDGHLKLPHPIPWLREGIKSFLLLPSLLPSRSPAIKSCSFHRSFHHEVQLPSTVPSALQAELAHEVLPSRSCHHDSNLDN